MAKAPLMARAATAAMATAPGSAWSAFDHWQAFFAAAGVFPATWEGLHVPPAPDTPAADEYEQRKLLLLSEWMDMLARRPAVLAHYTRQGIRARIVRQHAGPPCPACDPFNTREVSPGPDPIPPFHPGCRCVLLAAHTPRPRRRSKPYERPRSRTG